MLCLIPSESQVKGHLFGSHVENTLDTLDPVSFQYSLCEKLGYWKMAMAVNHGNTNTSSSDDIIVTSHSLLDKKVWGL